MSTQTIEKQIVKNTKNTKKEVKKQVKQTSSASTVMSEAIELQTDKKNSKALVFNCIKTLANNKTKLLSHVLSESEIKKIKACEDRKEAMSLTKSIAKALEVDSTAKKAQLSKNTHYCTIADKLFKFLKLEKFYYNYQSEKKVTVKK
jgi:hypothetical protein